MQRVIVAADRTSVTYYNDKPILGRTPQDEVSARSRDLYLHNTQHSQQTQLMPPAAFEPAIPTIERPLTHALERANTGISFGLYRKFLNTGNLHCNKEIRFTYGECDTDAECLIAQLFPFILFYFCLTLFKKYEF